MTAQEWAVFYSQWQSRPRPVLVVEDYGMRPGEMEQREEESDMERDRRARVTA